MKMKEGYLPVGSVVLLKGAKRGIVVIGYSIIEELLNRGQIEKVLFEGYKDEEGKSFLKALEESMSQIKQ